MSMLWGPVIIAAQLGGSLVVQTGSPDAMCPDLTQTREAVAKRLGTLEVDNSGWLLRYTIGHVPNSRSADFVRLELLDPQGTLKLERDLPLHGGSCSTMAQAIALVVDRFFRSLVHQDSSSTAAYPVEEETTADATRKADEAAPSPPQPRADASHEKARNLAQPSSTQKAHVAAPASKPQGRVNLGLLGSYLVESLGVQFTLDAPISNRLRLGFSTAIPVSGRSETLEGRSLSLQSYPQRLWLSFGTSWNRYWFDAGPELLTVIERADGRNLIRGDFSTRVIPGVGASMGAGAHVTARFGFGLRAGFDATHPPLARQFTVTTAQGTKEVLAPPRFRAALGAGIFFHF